MRELKVGDRVIVYSPDNIVWSYAGLSGRIISMPCTPYMPNTAIVQLDDRHTHDTRQTIPFYTRNLKLRRPTTFEDFILDAE